MDVSRESTATLRQDNDEIDPNILRPEDISDSLLAEVISDQDLPKRLIVAIDFGTTYSCVSYVSLDEGEKPEYLALDRIDSIQNFPNDWNSDPRDRMTSEVPTEVIYPLNRHFREQYELDPMEQEETGVDDAEEGNPYTSNESSLISVINTDDDDIDELMSDESDSFRWGYGVHEAWAWPATHSDRTNLALSRFKLLLDDSPITEPVRDPLQDTLRSLQSRRIIKKPLHVIADFLTCLLRHTRSELTQKGFDSNYKMEMVLCVPAIWSQKACRDMQTAMAIAMKAAKIKGVDIQNNSIENLFIVSEPEAAAAYVLATERDVMVSLKAHPAETIIC